jgi:hypothetical protein
MRHTLMICASVVALVAASGFASAQGMKEQPAAAGSEQKAPGGKTDRQQVNAPETMKPAPNAQAAEGKVDPKHNAPQKTEAVNPAPSAQAPERPAGAKSEGKSEVKSEGKSEGKSGSKSERVGQGGAAPAPHSAQAPAERTAPNAAASAEPKAGAPAELSVEHRTNIRETIRTEKVTPLTDVRFSIKIGEAVPRAVHLNRLPPRIVEYAPQYRGYEYVLVGEDILIVDPRTLRIVAVIRA